MIKHNFIGNLGSVCLMILSFLRITIYSINNAAMHKSGFNKTGIQQHNGIFIDTKGI